MTCSTLPFTLPRVSRVPSHCDYDTISIYTLLAGIYMSNPTPRAAELYRVKYIAGCWDHLYHLNSMLGKVVTAPMLCQLAVLCPIEKLNSATSFRHLLTPPLLTPLMWAWAGTLRGVVLELQPALTTPPAKGLAPSTYLFLRRGGQDAASYANRQITNVISRALSSPGETRHLRIDSIRKWTAIMAKEAVPDPPVASLFEAAIAHAQGHTLRTAHLYYTPADGPPGPSPSVRLSSSSTMAWQVADLAACRAWQLWVRLDPLEAAAIGCNEDEFLTQLINGMGFEQGPALSLRDGLLQQTSAGQLAVDAPAAATALSAVVGTEHAVFRPVQREAMSAMLDGLSVYVRAEVGAGKNIFVTWPATARDLLRLPPRITVVISPLLALCAEQAALLHRLGITVLVCAGDASAPGLEPTWLATPHDALRRVVKGLDRELAIVSTTDQAVTSGFTALLMAASAQKLISHVVLDEVQEVACSADYRCCMRLLKTVTIATHDCPIIALTGSAPACATASILAAVGISGAEVIESNGRFGNVEMVFLEACALADAVELLLAEVSGAGPNGKTAACILVYAMTKDAMRQAVTALNSMVGDDGPQIAAPYCSDPGQGKAMAENLRLWQMSTVKVLVATSRLKVRKCPLLYMQMRAGLFRTYSSHQVGYDHFSATGNHLSHVIVMASHCLSDVSQMLGRCGRQGEPSRAVYIHYPCDFGQGFVSPYSWQ